VSRFLIVFALFAATLTPPVIALGAPPGGLAVVRPTSVSQSSSARGSATQRRGNDQFKVPFNVNVHPTQLPESAQYRLDPYQTRGWETPPGYVLYPPACLNNGLLGPPGSSTAPAGTASQPGDFTIGSLVDQRSENLFSATPSYTSGPTGLAMAGNAGPATSSPLTFQYGLQSSPCGVPTFP
jgi:hypothetical protein